MHTPYPPSYFLVYRKRIGFADRPPRRPCFFPFFIFFGLLLVPAVHVFAQSPAPALVLTLDVKQPGCAKVIDPTSFSRVGNGSITVLASGGTPPYQYSISPGIFQNNAFFPALDAGNFSITVRDAAGATAGTEAVLSATLPEPSMAVNILSIPSTCTSADGSLELVPYGGAPPYTYSADGGLSFSSSNNIQSGLLQGYFYVFLMKDVNGCEAVAATNVEPHTGNYFMCSSCCPGFIVGAVVQVSCSGNGVLQVKMMGGTPPFLFSLDGVNYQPSDNATHPDWNTFKNLSPGLYHVYSKDAAGSVSQASFTLAKFCALALGFETSSPSCGQNDGTVRVTPQYGMPPYTYSIDGRNEQTSNVFSGLSAGNYNISVKDANGDPASALVLIPSAPQCLQAALSVTNGGCLDPTGSISVSATGGTAPYLYSLNGAAWQAANGFYGLPAGAYSISVQDAAGKTITVPATVSLSSGPQISSASVPAFCIDQSGALTISAAGGTPPLQYSLDNGIHFQEGNSFTGIHPGQYELKVQDAGGCFTDTTIRVEAGNCDCHFHMPNAFTPNNDGKNDRFLPKYDCQPLNYRLKIFNRLGQLVYSSADPGSGWNGRLGGSPQPEGVYIWFMEYQDLTSGKPVKQKGTVLLIR